MAGSQHPPLCLVGAESERVCAHQKHLVAHGFPKQVRTQRPCEACPHVSLTLEPHKPLLFPTRGWPSLYEDSQSYQHRFVYDFSDVLLYIVHIQYSFADMISFNAHNEYVK